LYTVLIREAHRKSKPLKKEKNQKAIVQAISETPQRDISLQLNIEEEGFLEVNIFDYSGKLVYNYANFVKKGCLVHRISRKGLRAKEYLLRVAQNGDSEIKKLSVH